MNSGVLGDRMDEILLVGYTVKMIIVHGENT